MALTEVQIKQKIEQYAPMFQKYDSPISVAVRMAQLGLESMWFTSELAQRANNGFGIKASAPWKGDSVPHLSGEVGGARTSDFRKYPSHEASIKDNAEFFTSTVYRAETAYKKAIEAAHYRDEANALTGIYAGDPNYGSKLIAIIEKYDLTRFNKKGSAQEMGYIGLDIGHGSNTWSSGGGKGVVVKGVTHQEHNFNSIVGKKLKALLEADGHKVTYGVQQPNSYDTSLRSRTDRFNAERVDIMVSIHANWIGNFGNSTNGIGAFYASYSSGTRTNNSKKLADLIMSEYRKQGQTIYGQGSIPSVLSNWTNFHMTREVSMPAVLMELGFMSGNKDFDKVFGSQQDKYTTEMAEGMRKGINAYFGVSSKPVSTYNPQGLKTTPLKPYVEPRLPWDELKVGDTVTLAKNWQWVDLQQRNLLQSKKYEELLGTNDKIAEIKVIEPGNHSKIAYRLDKLNSWILQEYLEESSASWELVPVKPSPEKEDDVDELELSDGEYVDKDGTVWIWKKKSE